MACSAHFLFCTFLWDSVYFDNLIFQFETKENYWSPQEFSRQMWNEQIKFVNYELFQMQVIYIHRLAVVYFHVNYDPNTTSPTSASLTWRFPTATSYFRDYSFLHLNLSLITVHENLLLYTVNNNLLPWDGWLLTFPLFQLTNHLRRLLWIAASNVFFFIEPSWVIVYFSIDYCILHTVFFVE